MLTFETVGVPEHKGVVDVTRVGDGDREDCSISLFDVSHAVRGIEVDAVNHVHQGQRDDVVLDGRVLVRLRRYSDFSQFIAVGLVDGRCLHSHVEPNVFASFEEDGRVGEDARMVRGKVEVRCPVHRHA